ncbi:D-sedoheptulose-7-phosphate isomerase [Mucilaginibacter ginkgonis]|uniref:Phosphoheptose isomerase n=1 Tax=Mucilaginibacter ginkgonis TaxID=2682091 RepID=A0A6I4I1Y2_9SPHI|nr:D-sedoheptulose 7-phosphate isomerase [Mucilaginibacter ginkgonis]QQL48269.1 D-sedoheptulose 7-phosphate isomerase [Mucilaginibacter ginkgonis]
MLSFIKQQITDSISTKEALLNDADLLQQIADAANLILKSYESQGKTLLAGNGGSAADAQHIAAEFVSRFYFDRPGLPSLALSTDTSVLTAVGNDYGYELLFSRQVEAHGKAGDVFIGISTSGNSPNILKALQSAGKMSIKTIGFTGLNGGAMAQYCDVCIKVPSPSTPRIQESHILIGHILCCIVEETLFGHLNKIDG